MASELIPDSLDPEDWLNQLLELQHPHPMAQLLVLDDLRVIREVGDHHLGLGLGHRASRYPKIQLNLVASFPLGGLRS